MCTGGAEEVSDDDQEQDDSAVQVAQATVGTGCGRRVRTSQGAVAGLTPCTAADRNFYRVYLLQTCNLQRAFE